MIFDLIVEPAAQLHANKGLFLVKQEVQFSSSYTLMYCWFILYKYWLFCGLK